MQHNKIKLVLLFVWGLSIPAWGCRTAREHETVEIGREKISITTDLIFPNVDKSVRDGILRDSMRSEDSISFLNLHTNENTSVVAAKTWACATNRLMSVTYIDHKPRDRRITFTLDKPGGGKNNNTTDHASEAFDTFDFDPNRMFSPDGREATLCRREKKDGHCFKDGENWQSALNAVEQLSTAIRREYEVWRGDSSSSVTLVLHNNGGTGYSARSYLKNGSMAAEAKEVNIVPWTNPRNFFFVVDSSDYDSLVSKGTNVVLQNSNPTDDGSLSTIAAKEGHRYVNIEGAAASGPVGDAVIEQIKMLEAMVPALKLENANTADISPSPQHDQKFNKPRDNSMWEIVGIASTVVVAVVAMIFLYSRARRAFHVPSTAEGDSAYGHLNQT